MNSTQLRKKIETFEKAIQGIVNTREILLDKLAISEDEETKFDVKKLAALGNELQDRKDILQKLRERLTQALADEEAHDREELIKKIVSAGKDSIEIIKKAATSAVSGLRDLIALLAVIEAEGRKYSEAKGKLPVDQYTYDDVSDLFKSRFLRKLVDSNPEGILTILESLLAQVEEIDFDTQADALRAGNEEYRLGPERERAADEKRERERAAEEEEQVKKHRVVKVIPRET